MLCGSWLNCNGKGVGGCMAGTFMTLKVVGQNSTMRENQVIMRVVVGGGGGTSAMAAGILTAVDFLPYQLKVVGVRKAHCLNNT